MIVWLPAGRSVVRNTALATPWTTSTGAVLRTVVPSRNCTWPVGSPAPGLSARTTAVNVTCLPCVEVAGTICTVVVVAAGLTVISMPLLLGGREDKGALDGPAVVDGGDHLIAGRFQAGDEGGLLLAADRVQGCRAQGDAVGVEGDGAGRPGAARELGDRGGKSDRLADDPRGGAGGHRHAGVGHGERVGDRVRGERRVGVEDDAGLGVEPGAGGQAGAGGRCS